MDLQTLIVLIIELIGTIAFSISGAMVGIRRKMDIFGVLVLGVVTAVGGGMMRDVILGKTPSAFVKPIYVEVAVISALAPFLLLSINKRLVHSKYQALYAGLMFLMDSVGLGIFTAVGVSTGWTAGYHDNMFFLSFLGVLTGVGGGLLLHDSLGRGSQGQGNKYSGIFLFGRASASAVLDGECVGACWWWLVYAYKHN